MARATRWAIGTIVASLAALGPLPTVQARGFDEAVKKIEARFEPAEAKPGQTVTFKLTVELAKGWHTYPTKHRDPNVPAKPTLIKPPEGGDVIFVGTVQEPADPHVKAIPELNIKDEVTYEGSPTWERKAVVSPKATPGEKTVKLAKFTIMVCDETGCLPPKTVPVSATLKVLDAPAGPVDDAFKAEVDKALGAAAAPPPPTKADAAPKPTPVEPAADTVASADHAAALESVREQLVFSGEQSSAVLANTGLVNFILTAMFWGLVTLATPCVFPMIPITVSVFLKQQTGYSPLTRAVVYCATIIIVLGLASLLLLKTFRDLSVSPWMNLALGAVFIVFAMSLFGMFELTVPHWLTNLTSKGEAQGGLMGTVFMALTFTLVSFSCVAPFMGGFGGMAMSGNFSTLELIAGALAFSTTFAAPFFVLALFPSLLRALPRSGSWLNTVKVCMGFLEMAAAIKFLRTAELRMSSSSVTFFTYDMTLGMYVALAILCGLYLLHLFRLPHDEPQESISVPRFLIGFGFLSLGLYLMPGLFSHGPDGERNRPTGVIYAWVDSFLLPEPAEGHNGLPWGGDLAKAVEDARAAGKLVFVDFTGKTCTNCKLNERTVFSKPEFKQLFEPYSLVQLYTDTVPVEMYPKSARRTQRIDLARQNADAAANLAFQRKAFGDETLPLYVILKPLPAKAGEEPKTQVVSVFAEGKINDEERFAAFLRKPQEGGTAAATVVAQK
jgi:thiol:disulfide interchange protein